MIRVTCVETCGELPCKHGCVLDRLANLETQVAAIEDFLEDAFEDDDDEDDEAASSGHLCMCPRCAKES